MCYLENMFCESSSCICAHGISFKPHMLNRTLETFRFCALLDGLPITKGTPWESLMHTKKPQHTLHSWKHLEHLHCFPPDGSVDPTLRKSPTTLSSVPVTSQWPNSWMTTSWWPSTGLHYEHLSASTMVLNFKQLTMWTSENDITSALSLGPGPSYTFCFAGFVIFSMVVMFSLIVVIMLTSASGSHWHIYDVTDFLLFFGIKFCLHVPNI